MAERVTLRPVEEDDLPVLLKLTQDPATTSEFAWAGWYDPRGWRRKWDEDGLMGPDGGTLMVVRRDEPVGMVNWRRHQAGLASHCWEMGIALLPEAHGQGYAYQPVIYTLPVGLVPALGGALWPVTLIVLQVVTNVFFARSGFWCILIAGVSF